MAMLLEDSDMELPCHHYALTLPFFFCKHLMLFSCYSVELVVMMASVIFAGQYLRILLSHVCCCRTNRNVARHPHIKHLFALFLFDSLPLI